MIDYRIDVDTSQIADLTDQFIRQFARDAETPAPRW